jgi:hypothetical protein
MENINAPTTTKPNTDGSVSAPPPSVGSSTTQQTKVFKFEDAIALIQKAQASSEPSVMKAALADLEAFCNARLKKMTEKKGDNAAGDRLLKSMSEGRAFKPWGGTSEVAK